MSKFFGAFGGQYVPEVFMGALKELENAYKSIKTDKSFWNNYTNELNNYVGRPTPLLYAENISRELGGAQVYIKLEGLANTGAHKINNALGQVLLAKSMGKKSIIAETGAGQHGVAVAAACARHNIKCEIFMGEVDIKRQQPNVFYMKQYGAKVTAVSEGTRTLKDAVNACMKKWAENSEKTYYLLGSALGPFPYPDIVREFQKIIGQEVKKQLWKIYGKQPDVMIACCGGGSNAIGFFSPFLKTNKTRLIAVEAGGLGTKSGQHARRMNNHAEVGIVEGYKSCFLQNSDGQVLPTHSISAGLDYAGIGPQLADLGQKGRIEFQAITDDKALEALSFFAAKEGLMFALESAHAAAYALELVPKLAGDKIVVINMSGRGDKDLFITAKALYSKDWNEYLRNELDGE